MIIRHDDLRTNLNLRHKNWKPVIDLLFYIFKIKKLNDLNERYQHITNGFEFAEKILDSQNIKIKYNKKKLDLINDHSSLIVIANHPHGILDGLLMMKLFGSNGSPSLKIVANHLLSAVKPLANELIIVNSFDDSKDHLMRFKGCKNVLEAFKGDHFVVFFPSADVSRLNIRTLKTEDPPWNKTFFKLIEKTECGILPLYIEGRNSLWYQMLGLIHPKLCLLELIPEFFRKKNVCIETKIGDVFYKPATDNENLPALLRKKVYDLKNESN